jgi:hypothetical protein
MRIFPISPADLLESVREELAVIRPDFSIKLVPERSESFWVLIKNVVFVRAQPLELSRGSALDEHPAIKRSERKIMLIFFIKMGFNISNF